MEMPEWDWEDVWRLVAVLLVLAAAILIVTVCFAPKNVDYYYLSSENSRGGGGYCVYAHWTWHDDELAYCSDDKDKVLDFATKANLAIAAKKK